MNVRLKRIYKYDDDDDDDDDNNIDCNMSGLECLQRSGGLSPSSQTGKSELKRLDSLELFVRVSKALIIQLINTLLLELTRTVESDQTPFFIVVQALQVKLEFEWQLKKWPPM